jgi:hypothetical protein
VSKLLLIVIKKTFPSQAFARDAISHCGDSIETAVDELKGPDCGNATEETEKASEVEKSDYVDEDTNNLDKLRLSKTEPWSCLKMMKAGKAGCSKQPDEDTTDETGEDDKAGDNEV